MPYGSSSESKEPGNKPAESAITTHDVWDDGTWECLDAARGRVTLRWRRGGYINQLALSADGRGLSSTDPSQQFVTARRIGAEAKAPAKKDASAPPPAPAQGDDAFLEGRRLAASGRCRDAIPHFNQAIQANPRHAKAYSDRGRCFAMLGQLERGLQDLDRAVESAPNNMSPYFNRAGLRADAGDGDGALADLDQSIRIDPMNAAARAARAGLFEVIGWAREAQFDADTAYRQVETFMPKKRPIVDQVLKTWRGKRVRTSASTPPAGGDPLQAAATAVRADHYRTALAILDAALRKHPGDDTLLWVRGRLHQEIGQAAQAVEDFTAVLQGHPSAHAFTHRGLA